MGADTALLLSDVQKDAILAVIQRRGGYDTDFRRLCLEGIAPAVRGALPGLSAPNEQLISDLNLLSDGARWDTGSVSLQRWMRSARRVTQGIAGCEVFAGTGTDPDEVDAPLPPRAAYFPFGQLQTLSRIGDVVAGLMEGATLGTGVVLFQADVELDQIANLLIRLKDDRDSGLPLHLPEGAKVWANWEAERRIELLACNITPSIDAEGRRRAQWCFSQALRRIIAGQATGADPAATLRSICGLRDDTHYILLHRIDTTREMAGITEYLAEYLKLWRFEPFEGRSGLCRFLLLIHVQIDPEAPDRIVQDKRAAIHAAVRRVVPNLDSDNDFCLVHLTGEPIDHIQNAERVRALEFQDWKSAYIQRVRNLVSIGGIARAEESRLIQEAEVVVSGLVAQGISLRMHAVGAALRHLSDDLADREARAQRR